MIGVEGLNVSEDMKFGHDEPVGLTGGPQGLDGNHAVILHAVHT